MEVLKYLLDTAAVKIKWLMSVFSTEHNAHCVVGTRQTLDGLIGLVCMSHSFTEHINGTHPMFKALDQTLVM